MTSINLNHLEAFCVLAETLSFSKTAQLLLTSQPAISRKIKILEENLGYELFVRSNKEVKLSKKGMELKDRILPSYQHLTANISSKKNDERIIKIGSIYEAGLRLLVPVLGEWQRTNQVNVEIHFSSAEDLMNKLTSGDIDFALIHRLPEQQTIISHEVFKDQAVLIGPNTIDPIQSLVTYRQHDSFTADFMKGNFSKKEYSSFKAVASVNSHQAMIEMVRTGHYCAVIPQSSLSQEDRQQVTIRKTDSLRYSIVLCARDHYLNYPEQKKEFMELVRLIKKTAH